MSTPLVGNTHLIAGNAELLPQLFALLQEEGIEIRGNPDIYVREYRAFGIGEARELRERATSRAIAGDRRIFIIVTPSMTNEAQNALLKTLEEPLADAMFFFVVPAPETLLPTLRSRAQTLVLRSSSGDGLSIDAKTFLAASPQKRLDMLKPLLEKDEDDPEADAPRRNGAGKRDLGKIISFLSELERTVALSPAGHVKRNSLEAVYRARKYIGDKGALVKPLLEQVALLVPVLK